MQEGPVDSKLLQIRLILATSNLGRRRACGSSLYDSEGNLRQGRLQVNADVLPARFAGYKIPCVETG